jgi:DNA-binding NarL/FixJ family response regulator
MAVQLIASVKTVETHRSKILHKLKLHSPVDLTRYAIRHGLVDP